jgi:HK97 family phage major capsid protein
VTASDKGWANVNLVAKTLAALSLISKNLEEDSIIDVVDDLAQEQAYAFALKEDQCWLIGDGTSPTAACRASSPCSRPPPTPRADAATNHDTFAEYDNTDI